MVTQTKTHIGSILKKLEKKNCYRVIMAHQGRIFVDSEPGKSTTVKIWLPLNEE